MRLKTLVIRNFRKINELTVSFPKGLCLIVGENNAGKTAIMDALRFMLLSGREFDALRLNEDDFRSGSNFAPIEITCIFSDPTEEDEVHFQECAVDVSGKFEIWLNARAEFNESTRRVNVKTWGGETESGSLPHNLYDHIASIYLQPLRDPETGLRPGRNSQVSRLIDCLTEEAQQEEFVAIAKEANSKIHDLQPIGSARDDINGQMEAIAGGQLAQTTELIFTDPNFYRIIAGLQPEIEGLPFALNGLGYNNLVFTSATLGTLRRSNQYSYRSILVEEPEAHLHPHLQVLLLRHLAKVASEKEDHKVQVIATSHSPILASQAPIDSLISIHESGKQVSAVSMCTVEMAENPKEAQTLKKKLQRFLDATRGELFFARRILMVEGLAEALLLPVLAKKCGGCLKDSAVTILNADGINFNAFLPLFGPGRLGNPIAILTDGDASNIGDQISATATALKAKEADIPNLRVEYCPVTFEHELARSPIILDFMLTAYTNLHPILGAQLMAAIGQLNGNDEKADLFLKSLLDSAASKGTFAQELAILLDDGDVTLEAVPEYIRNVFTYLGVIGG